MGGSPGPTRASASGTNSVLVSAFFSSMNPVLRRPDLEGYLALPSSFRHRVWRKITGFIFRHHPKSRLGSVLSCPLSGAVFWELFGTLHAIASTGRRAVLRGPGGRFALSSTGNRTVR